MKFLIEISVFFPNASQSFPQLEDEALKHIGAHCPELVTLNLQTCSVSTFNKSRRNTEHGHPDPKACSHNPVSPLCIFLVSYLVFDFCHRFTIAFFLFSFSKQAFFYLFLTCILWVFYNSTYQYNKKLKCVTFNNFTTISTVVERHHINC